MKKISFSIALLSLPIMAFGFQRTDAEMQKIARENLQLRLNARTAEPVKKLLEKEMLSVYGYENGGYGVVSRSNETSSIIGYSDQVFDINTLPDGLKWWLNQANRNLSEGAAGSMKQTAKRNVEAVAPLLTTVWAQEAPYNQLCPTVGGGFWGSTTPMTGCVATAMAQVLNYFEYPKQSIGTGQYSTDGQTFKQATMNTVYQWDKMRDSYTFNYSNEEANAVAALMRDCGYASKMVYTANGSGANIYDAAAGICNNMQYDPLALRVRTRAYYRDGEWMDMIYNELQNRRPILYMAVDPEKLGHSFVFDGLDAQGMVHVNWGWSGTANGYFDVSTVQGLNPSYKEPYYGSTISYNFYDEQAMVIGFKPQATPDKGEEYESIFVTYEQPQISIENDVIYISQIPLFNYSHQQFNGLLGLVVEDENGHAVVLPFFYSPWEDNVEIPVLGGVYFTEEYYPQGTLNEADMTTPRPDGKYRMYFVSWATQEMNGDVYPRYIRYPMAYAQEGKENYMVWEANIVNGHWDSNSLREVPDDIEAGVDDILYFEPENDVKVYGLDGSLIYSGDNPEGKIQKGVPVIVKKGKKAEKVIF